MDKLPALAGRRRTDKPAAILARTIERVAIAALAALAARGEGEGVIWAALSIFFIIAFVEAVGREVFVRGKPTSLFDLAVNRIATRRIRGLHPGRRHRRGKTGTGDLGRGRAAVPGAGDEARVDVPE